LGGAKMGSALLLLVLITFLTCFFPSFLVCGLVKFLYKKGEQCVPSHFRPITLLTSIGKFLERVVKPRFSSFLEDGIIPSCQIAYRVGYRMHDHIFTIIHLIRRAKRLGLTLLILFIDIIGCFDTVWREFVWVYLYEHGLTGRLWHYLQLFETGFLMCVWGSIICDAFRPKRGVPQGGLLSVFKSNTFLIQISDTLINASPGSFFTLGDRKWNLTQFSDDATPIGEHFDPELVKVGMSSQASKLTALGYRLGVKFHVDPDDDSKTAFMVITPPENEKLFDDFALVLQRPGEIV
jgi:hypothetical protein